MEILLSTFNIGIIVSLALLVAGLSVWSWWTRDKPSAPSIPSSATSPPSSSKKLSINLNMGIAQIHQIANQLVGIQLSGANVLAQIVSACSIVAGTVTFATYSLPGAWFLWIVAGIIGVGLAYLIEGLTLSNLIKIRLVNKQIKKQEAVLSEERDQRRAKIETPLPKTDHKAYKTAVKSYRLAIQIVEQEYRRKRKEALREAYRTRRSSTLIAFLGAIASAVAGGLFYHTIFSSIGSWESLCLAALLALVVTGTFVSNELFKEAQEQAIREGFAGGNLTDAAMREETKRLSARSVYEGILTHIQGEQAQEDLRSAALTLLKDIIQELRPDVHHVQTPRKEKVDIVEEQRIAGQNVLSYVGQGQNNEDIQQMSTGQHSSTLHDTQSGQLEENIVQDNDTADQNHSKGTSSESRSDRTLHFSSKHPNPGVQRTEEGDTRMVTYPGQDKTLSSASKKKRQDMDAFSTGKMRVGQQDSGQHEKQNTEDTQQLSMSAGQRIAEYRIGHPQATYLDISKALEVSTKTVQRHLKKSGQDNNSQRLKVVR